MGDAVLRLTEALHTVQRAHSGQCLEYPKFAMLREPATRGLNWLLERIADGALARPTPIGFYFAKLWYYERMYPLVFTVAALETARRD